VDGCPFEVIPNVERILRRLRHPEHDRVLWLDFICIDQKNTTEKEPQVPLMCAIYSCSSSVIA
ncbi:hypothetical protein BO71DRAFT_299763, partial [Aspergillus ellipticus CBS 707.79]